MTVQDNEMKTGISPRKVIIVAGGKIAIYLPSFNCGKIRPWVQG
jgi:hypothetical protein